MSRSVTVVDYGLGNLHSVIKALRHEGGDVRVTSDPRDIPRADRLVLPGVGAFADGFRGLVSRGFVEPLKEVFESGRPCLGICLGMELLLSESEEFGLHRGLGVFPGRVVAIRAAPGFKVPHIGWNRITPPCGRSWEGTILEGIDAGAMAYFVHSFTAVPEHEGDRLADAVYGGVRLSAVVHRNNVVGCQFHPEKSGVVGLAMLHRFLVM